MNDNKEQVMKMLENLCLKTFKNCGLHIDPKKLQEEALEFLSKL